MLTSCIHQPVPRDMPRNNYLDCKQFRLAIVKWALLLLLQNIVERPMPNDKLQEHFRLNGQPTCMHWLEMVTNNGKPQCIICSIRSMKNGTMRE